MNNIDSRNSSAFIKFRDKIIILLLIQGIETNRLIDLKIEDIKKLDISESLKQMILEFHKHNNKKKNYIFYTCKNNKITSKLINNIQKKYITQEIRGKCK